MKIDNQSDLSKLLDLCRKKGVTAISIDGISLTLAEQAPQSAYKRKQEETVVGEEAIDWNDLSPEEQMFYSAGGIPPVVG